MEKVKVTQEQARVIEMVRRRVGIEENIVRMHVDSSIPWCQEEYEMNELGLDDLIKALYIGYEVEPEYQLNELVSFVLNGNIYEIYRIPRIGVVHLRSDINSTIANVPISKIRKLTNKEMATENTRRWWAKHGREPWELETHDVLTHKASGGHYVVLNPDGDFVTFYGLYSSKSLHYLQGQFLVKYFAQDRKDI